MKIKQPPFDFHYAARILKFGKVDSVHSYRYTVVYGHLQGFPQRAGAQGASRFSQPPGFSGCEHGRASAILHLDKGKSVPHVAEITFLDEQTIRNLSLLIEGYIGVIELLSACR